MKPRILFTADVEDWPQSSWNRELPIGGYCAGNARRLLELMARSFGATGTFFVLGKFAEAHPDVVRAIHAAGHEIANHGYGHREIFRLGRAAFTEDLRRSTDLLASITGERPRGYRAPDFSVVAESLWALDVLAEFGYEYDSSIFPLDRGRYGIAQWPAEAARVRTQAGASIAEIPLTVTERFRRRWPVSGGGYARLLPGWALRKALESESRRRTIPPVFYCHPYELDAGEFRRLALPIPWTVRIHQGLGRAGFEAKLRMLVEAFTCVSFARIRDRLEDIPEFDSRSLSRAVPAAPRPVLCRD